MLLILLQSCKYYSAYQTNSVPTRCSCAQSAAAFSLKNSDISITYGIPEHYQSCVKHI